MKKLLALFVLILLSGIGFLVYVGYTYEAPKTITPQERVALANDWLKGLNEIYIRTGDKEISDQFLAIEKHGILAIPKQKAIIPQREMETEDFAIVPLTLADKHIFPWGNLYNSPNVAAYSGSSKVLVLKSDNPISLLYKGIVFSHELKHHSIDPDGALMNTTAISFCREEVTVHTFSNKLILKAGGDAYQTLLNKRAKEWSTYFSDTNGKPPLVNYLGDLEKIFGKSLSSAEDEIRVTNLEVGALYLGVDTYYTAGDKEDKKASIMCEMYKNNGNELPGEK